MPSSEHFTDHPKAVFLCGSFLLVMLHVDVCCAVASVPCSLWSPAGKGLTSWLLCVLCLSLSQMCPSLHRETGLSPPVKYYTDRSKAVLLLWIFDVFLSCVCSAFVCVCLFMPCDHLL